MTWKDEDNKDEDNISEDSEDICDAAGYVTPPPIITTDEEDTDTESDVSTDDSSSEESDAEERHGSRMIDLMLQWMGYIYATKIEEEMIYLRNCNGNIDWTHS